MIPAHIKAALCPMWTQTNGSSNPHPFKKPFTPSLQNANISLPSVRKKRFSTCQNDLTGHLVTPKYPQMYNSDNKNLRISPLIVFQSLCLRQQIGPVPICSTLNWPLHLSLSAPRDLSAPLHLFTSHVSFCLNTHHSSIYLRPNNSIPASSPSH